MPVQAQFFSILAAFLLLPLFGYSQQDSLPWLQRIVHKTGLADIHTVNARADVTVSDGLTYQTHTLFHDPQRAVFHRVYEDRTVTHGIEGKYFWSFDGTEEKEAPDFFEMFVLGHQIHAQILFFDKINPSLSEVESTTFNDQECYVLTGSSKHSTIKFYYNQTGLPLGLEIVRKEEANIVYSFDDWRNVSGVDLPFIVKIDDGSRLFDYAFSTVTLNQGSIADFRAPEELISDEQRLIRQHRIIMDGHFFGQTEEMKSQQSDSMTMLNDGEIFQVQGNLSEGMIDRIMASRDYTVYDDLEKPQVQVSDDGTLGWLIAKIYAKGIRYDDQRAPTGSLEFTCAWVELYEKKGQKWKLKGIVSTFRPDRK